MGSGKLLKTKTQITMAEEKKSLLNTCKNAFKWLKRGKNKPKEAKLEKNVKNEEVAKSEPLKVTPVSVLLEKHDKKKELEEDEENELDNFTHKIIDEEPRASIESQSSIDSGFTEKGTDNEKENDDVIEKEADDLTEKLKELKVDTDGNEKKKKTLQTVVIARRPVKSTSYSAQSKSHPYAVPRQEDLSFSQAQNIGQIQSQVNPHTLSGGHVIVNDNKADNIFLAQAVNGVDQSVEEFARTTIDEQELILSVADEYINKEWSGMEYFDYQTMNPLSLSNDDPFAAFSPENSMQFQQNVQLNTYDPTLSQLNYVEDHQSLYKSSIFPTPPRSENVPSPMSDTFYPTSSDYSASCTLSPPISSPMRNLDLEVCQPLDYPAAEEEARTEKKEEKETTHNLKYYKDLQKELSSKFSKKECCQRNRRTCKEIFLEHIQRLQMKERANICLKVANLQSEHTFAVLRYLIVKLSESSAEDTELVIFCLICDKMLAKNPELFVDDFGLELIKLAVLRCYSRPFVTRYLVQCVRVALNSKERSDATHLFTELDAQGDNLLHACIRKGDECADVLSELVRKDANELPLFNVHHSNSDGYMPLHLACNTHRATDSRLHTTHVLIEHADADIYRQEVKGGDTALHLAVNSPHCDLHLVMVLFNHFERHEWKRLAQAQNRSSVSARDYARSAHRSASRPNYPPEVLEFLKKCR